MDTIIDLLEVDSDGESNSSDNGSAASAATVDFDDDDLPLPLGGVYERNPPPKFPQAILHDGYQFAREDTPFTKLKVGDAVELLDHDGDFLRILYIIEEFATTEIYLRGWRFRRNACIDGRITPTKMNEITLLIDRDMDDFRPPLDQGMVTVSVKLAGKKRNLVITNRELPAHSWREHTSFSSKAPGAAKMKAVIRDSLELVCRWIYISEFADAEERVAYRAQKRKDDMLGNERMPRAATLRRIRAEEADTGLAGVDATITYGFIGSFHEAGSPYTFADICCGAGFGSLGARQAGLSIQYSVDHNDAAVATYQLNFPGVQVYNLDVGDFIHFVSFELHHVDVLHISFPCQFFSPAHTQPGPNDEANTNASFALQYLLERIRPRIVTMEQTSGLLTHHPRWFQAVIRMVTDLGYSLSWAIEDCANYGLAHHRKRLIIIGSCPGIALPSRPRPTHGPAAGKDYVSIADALEPLEDLPWAQRRSVTRHNPEMTALRTPLPPYSPHNQLRNTITTSGTPDPHPTGLRRFTVRELAMLQSGGLRFVFPDAQPNTVVTRQIGNAYPTCAARTLYEAVLWSLQLEDEGSDDW